MSMSTWLQQGVFPLEQTMQVICNKMHWFALHWMVHVRLSEHFILPNQLPKLKLVYQSENHSNISLELLPKSRVFTKTTILHFTAYSHIFHFKCTLHRKGQSNIKHEDFRPPSVCNAQGTPHGFWNGVDWRALVESRPPYIGKLRGWHFFFRRKKYFF